MKLNFFIYKDSPHKIYLQIYDSIKNIIDNGEVTSHEKLPSIRQVAIKFDINTLTVLKAYDLLEKNNYIYKIAGKGCFVKEKNNIISNTQKPVINAFTILNNNINFSSATPSEEVYPIAIFHEIINDIFKIYKEQAFKYTNTQGLYELRSIISEKLKDSQIFTSPENIQIVSGAQQALDLVKKIINKRKNTTMVVTNPTYYGAINTFSDAAKIISIPIEDDGVNIEKLEKVLETNKVDFFYCMINFQSPIGITWSMIKKKKLLELSLKYNFTIIEDDCLSPLYYYNNKTFPLKTLDEKNKVIYINSYSKLIMPGLRLGYMILPNNLVSDIVALKFYSDISSSSLMQRALFLFLQRGYWEPHMKNIRNIFRKKYELMLSLVKDIKELEIPYLPKGGFYLWVKLPHGLNSNLFYNVLKSKNISILPDSVFYPQETPINNFIRISFAATSEDEIKLGMEIIKKTLDEFLLNKEFFSKDEFIPFV